jgi:ornithine carbamoyltransferase
VPVNLRNRSFVKELDLSAEELRFLIRLAADLKAAKEGGTERPRLGGKNIALLFEKTSTRTRCAFEVSAYDQGARVTYIGPESSQIGHKESVKDTARVLGRMYDAIEYRGFSQDVVEELAAHAGVPVYNGLTDRFHPTQMLADMLTMSEHSAKPLEEIAYCYMGDASFNMGNSLMLTGCLLGMDVRICSPADLRPDDELVAAARGLAERSGARLTITDDVAAGVADVDFVSTDVWVSMGVDPGLWKDRIDALLPYQVNADVLALTKNPHVKFLHCLPAFHDRDSRIAEDLFQRFGLSALEVTDDVFESHHSVVFDEAENRVHTIKALLVATLAG